MLKVIIIAALIVCAIASVDKGNKHHANHGEEPHNGIRKHQDNEEHRVGRAHLDNLSDSATIHNGNAPTALHDKPTRQQHRLKNQQKPKKHLLGQNGHGQRQTGGTRKPNRNSNKKSHGRVKKSQ